MCECNSYDQGHCAYFDVEVGALTYGCTRGKMSIQHGVASDSHTNFENAFKPNTGSEARELSF